MLGSMTRLSPLPLILGFFLILVAGSSAATYAGSAGSDPRMRGTSKADTMNGNAGRDIMRGLGGADRMSGGSGHDRVYGGDGNDELYGGYGRDAVSGERGWDKMNGGPGDDILKGWAGDDTIDGDEGADYVIGGTGSDRIRGGAGDDRWDNGSLLNSLLKDDNAVIPLAVGGLRGEVGNDIIEGGTGSDYIFGGLGNDLLSGESEPDLLVGGTGNDQLAGGPGGDYLFGGPGDDQLKAFLADPVVMGGEGDDILHFNDGAGSGNPNFSCGPGRDTLVLDNPANGDDSALASKAGLDPEQGGPSCEQVLYRAPEKIVSSSQDPSARKQVLAVGDSLMAGVRTFLPESLPDYEVLVNARAGRSTPQGLQALRDSLREMPRPEAVVLSLGTNDGSDPDRFRARMREVLEAIPSRTCIVWLDIYRPARKGAYPALNRELRRAVNKDDRLEVPFWEHAVKSGKVHLKDGLHPDEEGYRYRSEMMARAVRSGCGIN